MRPHAVLKQHEDAEVSACQNPSGRQHWKDQVYKNSKTLANAITLASSNEFYCLQYVQFIRLLEKLLTLPYGPAEEELVQRFRKSVTVQSKKQVIEPVQRDERGMAFSTSKGMAFHRETPVHAGRKNRLFLCYCSPVPIGFVGFLLMLHWVS